MNNPSYEMQPLSKVRIDSIETNKDFSERKFWRKLSKYAQVAGSSVLRPALRLYFAARDNDTPVWARRTIIAALAYFILPFDSLPDFIPALGYSDDLAILAAALTTVAIHIKEEHQEQAETVLGRWFT